MSLAYSPSRNLGSSRMQVSGGGGGGPSRLRSSVQKKLPEPLRRAVADCLSPAAAAGSHHGTTGTTGSGGSCNPSTVVSEASRTLRDYLAAPSTKDLAYNVILEHTIAERDRSPAVVARCVAILKRYLLRYKPSEETLQQIDRFCLNTISECDTSPNRKLSPLSQTLSQQPGASTSINSSLLPVSSFASGALVKSLNYVRSLVAQHIPKRSFQQAAFAGGPHAAKQPLPSLSSFLSKSFNSQLSPVNSGEPSEKNDTTIPTSTISMVEKVDEKEAFEYIAPDVLKWRWLMESQSSFISSEGDNFVSPQDMNTHNFLEVGAAALLVGDMDSKIKGQPWKHFGTSDMPFLDQLLQPSPVTAVTDCELARPHLRAITASKRSKPNPRQIWDDSPVSTFRPRARPLFQYRHYSEQQPLRLSPAEVSEVISAACSETTSANANLMTMPSRLSNNRGNPTVDVAMSVLIKLVIDMYVMDSGTAAPLTLYMLEEMLNSPNKACRTRAFDLILNLGVHAHLLEPMKMDDTSTIEEDYSQELYFDKEAQLETQGKSSADSSKKMKTSSAIENLETWILNILYEILLLLVQIEEKEESVWASALSCLLYFICDRGQIMRSRIKGLDIRVIKSLMEISRKNSWAEVVHSKLVCMLTNMFYHTPDEAADDVVSMPVFLIDQIDLIGGIVFIFLEYSLTNSREERRNLYLVLFDYVLHQINKKCAATEASEYSIEEIQLLGTMLTLADAPEAFYISVKLGVEGIGRILKRSISAALSRYPNSERLNMLLESITEEFDELISVYTHLDKEFSNLMQITKTYKFLETIDDKILMNSVGMKSKLSWSTLHSLLHSERIAYRLNGYAWLGDLLITEISERRDTSVWSNIKNLQLKIKYAGVHDYSAASDVPLSVWLLCGLLKSKHNRIRWGFLFVLERLLMRCKFLLDENETRHNSDSGTRHVPGDSRLEKANTVIDIMSSALSLVAQINETDRINILKMCDILFSQLCLKVPPATAISYGDRLHTIQRSRSSSAVGENKRSDATEHVSLQENCQMNEFTEENESRPNQNYYASRVCETASMAALLLHGQAIVPMQLVARVPAALFYWPLIQLASAATDNIALGVAVGSKGRGNLPGATSDIRAALLLLLIGKCTADRAAFEEVGGEDFFRELLGDTDSRVAYYSSAFLLKRMMTEKPEKYQNMLQNLVFKAQQCNNEKLLENPYLQMRGILQLANDLGTEL